jgi:hypothetical protein
MQNVVWLHILVYLAEIFSRKDYLNFLLESEHSSFQSAILRRIIHKQPMVWINVWRAKTESFETFRQSLIENELHLDDN